MRSPVIMNRRYAYTTLQLYFNIITFYSVYYIKFDVKDMKIFNFTQLINALITEVTLRPTSRHFNCKLVILNDPT